MEQEKKQPDVRLIGLDLDGTTLTSDKVLTPHTRSEEHTSELQSH